MVGRKGGEAAHIHQRHAMRGMRRHAALHCQQVLRRLPSDQLQDEPAPDTRIQGESMKTLICRGCGKPKATEYCPRCGDNRSTTHPHGIRVLAVIWSAIIAMLLVGVLVGVKP